ncbi:MAG TPA: PAC2 family protein [Acidimicrobiales bacterium]|nr:PAC2 family protein [Acidimicrobiales bacterium]
MTLYERHLDRVLDRPVLVVALEGWVDAGLGADGAISALLSAGPTELLATFDGESLIDQRARRPVVHIVRGINEGLTWPVIQMRLGQDLAGAEMCFLVGPEPDFRWPSFVSSVVGLCGELGVRIVVGLGAFPAPAPHTRPVRLAATAPPASADLVAEIGIVQGEIDVPSGVWGALELALGEAGIAAVGLWARVPHYVSGMAFPSASAALLDGLAAVSGLSVDASPLHTAADASLRQVDDLISKSGEHTAMVRQLEHSVDTAEGNPLDIGELPTGDELAAELERYLRDEREEHGEPGDPGDGGSTGPRGI